MTPNPIGLYVHIPFCVRKCNYCDFCSFSQASVSWKEEYIDALVSEIRSYKSKGLTLDSIFFGGGTPSLLEPNEFVRILDSIKDSFYFSSDLEFTLEVNPGTITEEKAKLYAQSGVNRISIGMQSIHENELKMLGRIHNYEEFLSCYKLIKDAGISNINVDVMYGIPCQTKESFLETLEAVTSLSPSHISLYGLILEEGTPFYEQRSILALPEEDTECDMYFLAAEYMKDKGYSHYEISNYALPGFECRHNLKYWRCKEYIGVGLAAYSYFEGRRFGNSRDTDEYLKQNDREYEYEEIVDADTLVYEYVMLGLRLKEGISFSDYEGRFGKSFLSGREKTLDALISGGYAKIKGERLSLTERGFYVSNRILTDLI